MKVLQSSDWHLRDKNIDELTDCINFLTQTAKDKAVDLIVIAGDIFDSRDIRLDSRAAKLAIKTVSALADIAPVAVILGTPSHDGAAPEILRYARGAHFIHVSTIPEQIYLTGGELGNSTGIGNIKPQAVLTMIPQPTKQYLNQGSISESNETISQAMSAMLAGFGAQAAHYSHVPHLLIGHWNISGSKLSNGQTLTGQEIDISIDQMALTNASAHMIGHIHLPQQMSDRTFYSGSLCPLNWGENHDHGFYLHEFDADDLAKSEFILSPCRKMSRFVIDLTAGETITLPFESVAGSSVRVDIRVYQDEAAAVGKEEITANLMRWGAVDADVRLIRVPRQTVRSEAVLKVETLRDKLIAMAALKGETVSESILRKADALEAGIIEEAMERAA